jgi:DNA-binding transcriptional ArsR family regulator
VDEQTQARTEARAHILKALAHPTRLFIVEELARGERCVCELQEMVGSDMSTVSKHLAQLRQAGLVVVDKRGTQVFYTLRVPCILNFFGCVDSVMQANADQYRALAL